MKHEKALGALKKRGVDLINGMGNPAVVSDGEAVYGAITDLAQEAIDKSCNAIREKANAHKTCAGLTNEALDQIVEFEEIITKQERLTRKTLESVRSLKSAMVLELKMLSNVASELERLNINKIAADLENLCGIFESETIQKLLGK